MTLDLPALVESIDRMSRETARRAAQRAKLLPDAERALRRAGGMDPRERSARLERASENPPGSLPTDEPLHSAFAPPQGAAPARVIGADGSQIYPDRHGPALYYLINVGGIVLRPGSSDPPRTTHRPLLFYEEDDLYAQEDQPISAALLNGRRDVAELSLLADLGAELIPGPTLALLDNGLLLWAAMQERDRSRSEVQQLLAEHLKALSRLRQREISLAGFIDRPRHTHVLELVHLLSAEGPGQAEPRSHPYRGLSDRDLFRRLLPPGHRSARFVHATGLNGIYKDNGHGVEFFYLHTGYDDQVARVEIPEWVGSDPERLAAVHAGIVEQCRFAGEPYALIRAHELALVTRSDREALEALLQRALLEQGMLASVSHKARTKRWTGRRPRRAGQRR